MRASAGVEFAWRATRLGAAGRKPAEPRPSYTPAMRFRVVPSKEESFVHEQAEPLTVGTTFFDHGCQGRRVSSE